MSNSSELEVKQTVFHFCSTPFNLYISAGYASERADQDHLLLIIDQEHAESDAFVQAVLNTDGPFIEKRVFAKGKGRSGKRTVRLEVFEQLDRLLDSYCPSTICVGNDRRLEYQYMCHLLKKRGLVATSIYLDEGLGTYYNGLLRSKMKALDTLYIQPLSKMLAYGSWHQSSRFFGGTKNIDECMAMFPQLCPEKLGKQIQGLSSAVYLSDNFSGYIAALVNRMLGDAKFDWQPSRADILIALPHSGLLKWEASGLDGFVDCLRKIGETGLKVQIKYHPKEAEKYLSDLQDVEELPQQIPLEMCFQSSGYKAVVGGLSTAMLSAKWLFPKTDVICIGPMADDSNHPHRALLKAARIELLSNYSSLASRLCVETSNPIKTTI